MTGNYEPFTMATLRFSTRTSVCLHKKQLISSRPALVFLAVLSVLITLSGCSAQTYGGSNNNAECNTPLGMENHEIFDHQITASSSFDQVSVGPQNGRIRTETNGGAWCPQRQIDERSNEWIQIEFIDGPRYITAIETQGRYGAGHGVEYPPGYRIQYWHVGAQQWIVYIQPNGSEIIQANTDTINPVYRSLASPLFASKVRLIPWAATVRTVCIRLELFGCKADKADTPLLYSSTKPSRRYPDWAQQPITTVGGIGLLNDGKAGRAKVPDRNITTLQYVGWRSSDSKTVTINLTFDQLYNVSSINVHTANWFTHGIGVFDRAIVRFGFDQRFKRFQTKVIDFDYLADDIDEPARWVKIGIPGRIARVVQLQLVFAHEWLLISEIAVEAEPIVLDYELTDLVDNSASEEQYIVPVMFQENAVRDAPSVTETRQVTVYTVEDVPTHYVTIVIAVTVSLILISAVIILLVYQRYHRLSKEAQATAAAYASAYTLALRRNDNSTPTTTLPLEDRSTSVFNSTPRKLAAKVYAKDPSTDSRLSSSYLIHQLNNQQNAVIEAKAGLGSSVSTFTIPPPPRTPPNRPCPKSPPPEYRSHMSTSSDGDESSEYADVDEESPCSSQTALLQQQTTAIGAINKNKDSGGTKQRRFRQTAMQHVATQFICRDQVGEVSPNQLRFIEKLGQGQFGEVHLCELLCPDASQSLGLVAAKLCVGEHIEWDYAVERKLRHAHVLSVLGYCKTQPTCMITEYMHHGDLCTWLKDNAHLYSANNIGALLEFGVQIASGMSHFESLKYVHRDLAARNCLLDERCRVKIGDFGMARSLNTNDYYKIEGNFMLPIRWMAYESMLMGQFSSATDVWAFGVCLWEIMTLCQQQPYAGLTDQQVIDNVQHMHVNGQLATYLPSPAIAPPQVYNLMRQCWLKDSHERPKFKQIHVLLLSLLNDYNHNMANTAVV